MIQKILKINNTFSVRDIDSLEENLQTSDRKSRFNKLQLILKATTAILCTLFLWEVILQNTLEKSTGSIAHPVLGKIAKPGVNIQGEEGFSRTKINDLGMRGENITPKAKNEYRILAFGDSYTRAVQVADDKTYSYLLQNTLKNKSNLNIKSINAGRDGASPAYYIYLADFYKSVIEPDRVIVQITDQDFTEDIFSKKKEFYLTKKEDRFKTIKNQNTFSDDALSQIFLQKFPQLRFMLEYSVLRVGGKNLQSLLGTKQNKLNLNPSKSSSKKSLESSRYDAVIEWTIKQLKTKYSNLIILYLPDYNNINQNPSEIETAFKKFTAKNDVDFANMREDFTNYYQVHHQRVHGFNNTTPGTGHINEIGHYLTAERLAKIIESRMSK